MGSAVALRSGLVERPVECGLATPRLAWALCTVARSGSSWLSQLVGSTNCLGYPDEYLLDWPSQRRRWGLSETTTLAEYLDCLLRQRTSPNGVFAIKGSLAELTPLFDLVPDMPCVWLSRENKIEQAVSWHRAHDGGVWTRTAASRPAPPVSLVLERVLHFHDEIMRREAAWLDFFLNQRAPPLVLTYEGVCRDPLSAVRAIASHVGVDPHGIHHIASPLRIVRDQFSSDMVHRAEQALRARG